MFEIVTDKSAIQFSEFFELHREIFSEQKVSESTLRALFDQDNVFVFLIKSEAKNSGFLFFQKIASELEIFDIGILSKSRCQGLASKLLEKLFEFSNHNAIDEIQLEVRSKNAAAMSLYTKHRFQKTGLRQKYYQDGDDAVLMSLKI